MFAGGSKKRLTERPAIPRKQTLLCIFIARHTAASSVPVRSYCGPFGLLADRANAVRRILEHEGQTVSQTCAVFAKRRDHRTAISRPIPRCRANRRVAITLMRTAARLEAMSATIIPLHFPACRAIGGRSLARFLDFCQYEDSSAAKATIRKFMRFRMSSSRNQVRLAQDYKHASPCQWCSEAAFEAKFP